MYWQKSTANISQSFVVLSVARARPFHPKFHSLVFRSYLLLVCDAPTPLNRLLLPPHRLLNVLLWCECRLSAFRVKFTAAGWLAGAWLVPGLWSVVLRATFH